ncbi:hypothetical protein I6G25_11230 (plasmid) [Macrococcoides caseolyticum]|uniref:phospholipase A2 family protein n=1 Tax=Macrococcoides caseolyticum TaxID=69966 RepID=UPI000CD02F7D|nr:phospholipase A2 family protein [Macrococcus caseolyticus]PNZ71408.1 hypothetical protein CD152_09840 [Macrococcus caseolyticus]QPT47849.1 hypothetical protein I6G25_11230 [Macrococcus caseolyticus]
MRKILNILLILLGLTLILPQPTFAVTNQGASMSDSEFQAALSKSIQDRAFAESYIQQDSYRMFILNKEKIRNNKLSKNDQLFIEEYIKLKNQEINKTSTRSFNVVVYGKYCGKGDKGGSPIDTLDKACQAHDRCYANYGWGNCNCDRILLATASVIASSSKYGTKQRIAARAVTTFFAPKVLTC